MCGIVGYVGGREACPVLLKGLHRLEYRGYDSAGVAMVGKDGALNVYKCKGKVSDLEHFLEGKELGGSIGIAHTRWATHGVPNDVNAHPHYSESENIALIHNGIIENYRVLKDALEENGYTFRSSTDSEVLVNLIEYIRTTGGCTLLEAVQQALRQVVGAYAIAVIEKGNRDEIIAARQSSPMAIGIGEGEFFLSSDAASVIEYTQDFVYVNDGEIAVINRHKPLKIVTLDNHEGRVDIKKLQMSISQLEKGGYPHFMLKEIYEQPKTIVDCIRGRISPDTYEVKLSGVIDNRGKFLAARRIVFVACGTSWHAALIGEHLIENICRIPVEVEYASEFRYRNPIINADDIVIAVSQSGETADTLAAVELARKAGAFVFGICNVVGSSIARATDSGAYIHVGPEIGVASTKAFTGQVTVMAMLAIRPASTDWQTTTSASAGMPSAAQLPTAVPMPASESLFRNRVAPSALDPMPASQAKTTLRICAGKCSAAFTAGAPLCAAGIAPVGISSAAAARRTKGAAMSSDTAVEISTPASTTRVWPLGAMASTEMMLPGEAGATSPAPASEKNSSPAALPATGARISAGRARI